MELPVRRCLSRCRALSQLMQRARAGNGRKCVSYYLGIPI